MPTATKFALYDFNGNPREFYLVDEIEVPRPVLEPTVSHHVVIIDRSGSMYGVMNDTKSMVEKVMVAEEFTSSSLLLTLISYSSKGDFTTHFARTPVADVLDPNKPHVAAIRNIRATCLTSVSGALDEALNHVQAGETTAISVHTDGYFNDSSPATEAKAVDKWLKRVLKDFPNVYANTVAYGNWTDFKMLDRISQTLSGKTVVAKNVKQVYDALHDTSAILAGRVLPAIHIPTEEGDFLAFHNVTQKKVNGSATDFKVKGVGPDDETRLYRFRKVTENTWTKFPLFSENSDLIPAYVFARTALGQQRLNDAKYTLVGTRDASLIAKHYKALTSSALAEMAVDLEARIAGDTTDLTLMDKPGLGFDTISVMELGALLQKFRGGYTLDLPEFLKGYNRRGVARTEGKWVEGVFVRSKTELRPTDEDTLVEVTSFDLNNTTANINMQVVRSADLYKDGEKVVAVGGKKLGLKEIRSYTLVGDGEINASTLPLNISSKALYAELVKAGVLTGGKFDPKVSYVINLTTMAACPFGQSFDVPEVFDELLGLTVKRAMFSTLAAKAAKADEWNEEQLVELKAHDLSASLNYNPSTSNPYTDLNEAISAGEVDSYTSYNITLGDARMVSLKALYSANEYLSRRFTLTKDGEELKKPKFEDFLSGKVVVTEKVLSARTKLNAIDAVMFPIYKDFILGGGVDGLTVASDAGAIATKVEELEERIEAVYDTKVRPVAFYVGATGLIPEGWDVSVLDAEGLKTRFPDIDIEKKQLEGTFFVSTDIILGVFPEVAYFSTPLGVAKARVLEIA